MATSTLLGRDVSRARLASAMVLKPADEAGPQLGIRKWRIAAGVLCGQADHLQEGRDALAEFETNHLHYYGGFGNLEVARRLGVPGLTAFGFVEFTDSYARIKQTGAEVLFGGDAGPQGSAIRNDNGVGVTMFNGRVGLSYDPPGWNHSRFLIGYHFETYFQVGRLTDFRITTDSRGQIDTQGLFLRAEFNF